MVDLAQAHDELRPLMFSIVYRMLGGAQAEGVVQDAFLRLHRKGQEGADVENPAAYATTCTTRLAIDTLRSARVRREEYVVPWLPDPSVADDADPAYRMGFTGEAPGPIKGLDVASCASRSRRTSRWWRSSPCGP